jgi:uncharacterized membrane protein
MGYQTNEEIILSNINASIDLSNQKAFKTYWLTSDGDILASYSPLEGRLSIPSALDTYGISAAYDTMILVQKRTATAGATVSRNSADQINNIGVAFADVITAIDAAYSTTIASWALEIVDLKIDMSTMFNSSGVAVSDITIATATVNVWIAE